MNTIVAIVAVAVMAIGCTVTYLLLSRPSAYFELADRYDAAFIRGRERRYIFSAATIAPTFIFYEIFMWKGFSGFLFWISNPEKRDYWALCLATYPSIYVLVTLYENAKRRISG